LILVFDGSDLLLTLNGEAFSCKVREIIREFLDTLIRIAPKHNMDLRELAKKLYEAFTSNEDFSDLGIRLSLLDDLVKTNIAYRRPEKIYGLQLKASPFRAGMVLIASRCLFLEGLYGL